MSFPYVAAAADARLMAMHRLRATDPTGYPKPGDMRWDAKFGAVSLWNEVLGIVESESVGRRVRVKNATGGTFVKGTLVHPETAKLSPQASGTAVNNPLAGAGVVINVSATFEVGELVRVESGGNVDVAIATAASAGVSVTVDMLYHDHETPTVTSLAAYEITKSDADGALPAEWVLPADIAAGAYGWAYACIELTGLDTSAFSIEAMLYLSATAGTYTATAPTGADQIVQAVGIVKKAHATTGIILFFPGNKRILKFGSSFLQSGAVSVAVGDISGLGSNVAAFLATPSSANLRSALTDETGTGAAVFATSPTLVTPALGTPSAGVLTNCTGLPVASGISGLAANIAAFLATPSSANLAAALTDETGTGANVFATSPTLVTPLLGTPTSGLLTNCTGLPIATGLTGLSNGQSPVQRAGSIISAYVNQRLSKSGAYTVVASDNMSIIECDASSAGFTVALTAAATLGAGHVVTIIKIDSTANRVTIDANGSETINGNLTNELCSQYGFVQLYCTGSGFLVIDCSDVLSTSDTADVNVGTSLQYENYVSLSVPPGLWKMNGMICFALNSATVTEAIAAVSAFSGNTQTDHVVGDNVSEFLPPVATCPTTGYVNNWAKSQSTTAPIYLKGTFVKSAGTPILTYGSLKAERLK